MPISLIIVIVQAIIEIIKLIAQLRKDNPVAASQCAAALKEARQHGDQTRIRQILDSLKNGGQCKID